jgi:hypothetical protein
MTFAEGVQMLRELVADRPLSGKSAVLDVTCVKVDGVWTSARVVVVSQDSERVVCKVVD